MANTFFKIKNGLTITPSSIAPDSEGDAVVSDSTFRMYLGGSIRDVVTADGAATLTNKIIDAGLNTLSNIGESALSDGAVTSAKISDESITQSKLSPSITFFVSDGTITTAKLSDEAVTTAKLADISVTTAKVSDGSITLAKLDPAISLVPADGSITTAKLSDASVTLAKLDPSIVIGVSDLSITTAKLADLAVTTAKVSDGSITQAKLDPSIVIGVSDLSITTAKLADLAVTTAKVSDGSITLAKLDPSIGLGGTGDVTGPASSTSNAIAVFDGVTGKAIIDTVLSATTYVFTGIGSLRNIDYTKGFYVESIPGPVGNEPTEFVTVRSGAVASGGGSSGDSGDVSLVTGDSASSDSGDILLTTGTATSERGRVLVDSRTIKLPTGTSDPTGTLSDGDFYYNTSTGLLRKYNGSNWGSVGGGGSGGASGYFQVAQTATPLSVASDDPIVYDTEIVNTGVGTYNNTTGEFTSGVTGAGVLTVTARTSSTATKLYVQINAATPQYLCDVPTGVTVSASAIVELTTGDVVTIRIAPGTAGIVGSASTKENVWGIYFGGAATPVASSAIYLDSPSGYGSTGTNIRRFSNSTVVGAGLTYLDDPVYGATITIVNDGIYNITTNDYDNASFYAGASKNTSLANTAVGIETLTRAQGQLFSTAFPTGGYYAPASYTLKLVSGDIIRPHTGGASAGVLGEAFFFNVVEVGSTAGGGGGGSEIQVYGGSGLGSTNTSVRRFTSVMVDVGAAITYAPSASLGDSFEINSDGIYSITYTDGRSGGIGDFSMTVDGVQLTTNPDAQTATSRKIFFHSPAANVEGSQTWSGSLSAGEVVRAQADSDTDLTGDFVGFHITKLR